MDQPQVQPNMLPNSTKPVLPPYLFLSIIFFVTGLILFIYSVKVNQSANLENKRVVTEGPESTELQMQKKQSDPSPQITSTPLGNSTARNSVAPTTVVPPGYKEKDTICYRMYVPDTSVLGADNGCTMYFSINRSFPLSLKVDSEYIDSLNAGDKLSNYTKKRIVAGEVLKDENTIIDGLTAQLIVEKTHPTNGDEIYRMFVDVSPKEYEVNGYPIGVLEFSSVIVNGDHKEEALNTFNIIIGSLIWK